MIDYSLGCILANDPVSYEELKMKSYLRTMLAKRRLPCGFRYEIARLA